MAKQEFPIKKLPYTVVGHSTLGNPSISILLTAEGIKALAKIVKNGDMVRYTAWRDVSNKCQSEKNYQEFILIRSERKS